MATSISSWPRFPRSENAKDYKVIPLTSDRLGVACRAGHPLTRMKRVTLKHLLDYPWSMPPLSTHTTRRLTGAVHRRRPGAARDHH